MAQSDSEDNWEMKVPFLVVILALGICGFILTFTSDILFQSNWDGILEIALLYYAISFLAWFLYNRWPVFGQWATLSAVVLVVLFSSYRLSEPTLICWLILPNILAAAYLGYQADLAMTIVETFVIVFLKPNYAGTSQGIASIGLIWGALLVTAVFTCSIQRVMHWSYEYYRHAMGALDEARDRQAELNQALLDLASANQQLSQLNKLSQSLREIADNSRKTKEQFVANVSHELRTPLNMIIGFSEMILENPDSYGNRIPSSLLADLRVVYRNAQHLSSLIDDVLDLSQIDMQEMALTKENVNIHKLIDAVVIAVRPLFESKNLFLETEFVTEIPPVFCDPTRISEVLLNLLSNAGRFTERGGVRVRVWYEKAQMYISVSDTGLGISAEGIRNLFEPFYQVDGSIRRRFGGTGLGLCISKRLVELHDGRIWVESKEGTGTTFTFFVPISSTTFAHTAIQEIVPDWEFHQRTHAFTTQKPNDCARFAVIEKGKAFERLLKRYMGDVEIIPFPDLPHALSEAERYPFQAFLVNSSTIDEMVTILGSSINLPNGLPVFICSIPDMQEQYAELGVAFRLVKPISREMLIDALQKVGVENGTVLIVDDETDILQLFGRMLASVENRYRTLIARDGEEMLEIIKRTRPDVILLDLMMPKMNGFEILEERNSIPEMQDIPIIIISAQDPTHQPIVSSCYANTRGGGITIPQLLNAIRFTCRSGALSFPTGVPELSEVEID
jgi:signal transduction histidine kinase/CheY-like chemotaxis protein